MNTFVFPDYPAPATPPESPFAVWAPSAEGIALAWRRARAEVEGETPREYGGGELAKENLATVPLAATGGGWFAPGEIPAELAAALESGEVDYGYRIGEAVFPDPRSRHQPHGVHGPSRTWHPGRVPAAADAGAWPGRALDGSPIYELHIGTFTPEGTFDAAAKHLEHLASLGLGFVEILPVNAFGGHRNWGYDGVGWYAVQETYGGPAGLRRFVDAAHGLGLGVILDVVYNHLGPSGNYLGSFGPYLHAAASNPWGDSINLDGPDSDEVRRHILDNLGMWARDFSIDAFRLDAVHAYVDARAVPLLEDMSLRMAELSERTGKPIGLIAESDMNNPRVITARSAGGLGIDAQWSDDWHHALHSVLTGETQGYYADFSQVEALAKVSRSGFFHDGSYSSFRGRHHGQTIHPGVVTADRLVVFTQDHDQVGNRAAGERLSQLLTPRALSVAAVLLLTSPGTPMLFMGEEWGASTPWQFFTDHREDWLAKAVTEGRRKEFADHGWNLDAVPDPQDPETFRRSVLDWDESTQGGHGVLLGLYQRLGQLRAQRLGTPHRPRFDTIEVRSGREGGGWIRIDHGGLSVVATLGDAPVPLSAAGIAPEARPLLDTEVVLGHLPAIDADAGTLAAMSAVVLESPVG